MGVSDQHVRHNHGASVLLDGARKLGWHAKACPQNTNGAEHYCGRCHHGCGAAEKQGPGVCWLPAASRSGARFIEGMRVSRVVFDEKGGSNKAIGIVGRWVSRDKDGGLQTPESERTQRTVQVTAKKVIVSGGSLQSPLLLMRSGLKVKRSPFYLQPSTIGLNSKFIEPSNRQESPPPSCCQCPRHFRSRYQGLGRWHNNRRLHDI